jgi:hypothetical protein
MRTAHVALSIIVLIFVLFSIAGSEEVLLSVPSQDLQAIQKIPRGDYRLYAVIEGECLIGLEPSAVETLVSRGIAHNVIAEKMEPRGYYLVTLPSQGGDTDLGSVPGLAYRMGDVAVVKADESEAQRLSRIGFELANLLPLQVGEPIRVPREGLTLRKRSGDGLVERLLAEVSAESLEYDLRRLEEKRTRYSYTDSCWSAGQWIYDRFQSSVPDVSFHDYEWGAEQWRNIVATIPGKYDSTAIVIICGHFDSISEDPWNLAPGSEDNGSGSAVVMEAARILSREEHDYTLRFICFSGEEQGLIGSYYYVTDAFARGDKIVAAMNFDMVGYTDDERYDLSVRYDSNSIWLGNMIMAASRFTQAEPYSFYQVSPNSDHWYFQQYGYPATMSIHIGRISGYPCYHSVCDTVGNLNMDFLKEVTKMAVAAMAMIGNGYPTPPLAPDYVAAVDAGTGGTLEVDWSPSASPGVLGYNVYYGSSPRRYEGSAYTDSTALLLGGLENGTRCFLSVTAIDDNSEGGYSGEVTAVPGEIPSAPDSLSLLPLYLGMELFWRPNPELDLGGYNVYRGTESGGPYDMINASLVQDTSYVDSGLESGVTYYYVVTAVDTVELEGPYSQERNSIPLSLDHGILLVDETRNGSGGTLPPDSLQDSFYQKLLSGYDYQSWDYDSSGLPGLTTMGLYSTIIWRSEDIYEHYIRSSLQPLGHYLSQGGNLWFIGWKAIEGVMDVGEYPFTFSAGDWPFDYLGLSSSDNTQTVGLVVAEGAAGYPSATVDSLKAPSGWNGSLYLIDTAVPWDADVVSIFHSDGSDTSFDGEPIAVRYTGPEFKTVFFGFPLYYMRYDDAQALTDAVLGDFGEPKGVLEAVDAGVRPQRTVLREARPNPFSRATRIRAVLTPEDERTEDLALCVYDISGRLVRTLSLEHAGQYLTEAIWDGDGDDGHPLPSGTYFCTLSSGGHAQTRKLTLLR